MNTHDDGFPWPAAVLGNIIVLGGATVGRVVYKCAQACPPWPRAGTSTRSVTAPARPTGASQAQSRSRRTRECPHIHVCGGPHLCEGAAVPARVSLIPLSLQHPCRACAPVLMPACLPLHPHPPHRQVRLSPTLAVPVLIRCLSSPPHPVALSMTHVCSGAPPVIIPDDVAAGYVADAPPLLPDEGVDTSPEPSTGKVRDAA